MRVNVNDVNVKMQIPGAVLRLQSGFGKAGDLGGISAEAFSLAAGVDTTPLFEGLEGDLCQCPHWGFVRSGRVTTTDANGKKETVKTNDLFYWPPGHNVKVEEDAELILFSPERKHVEVIDHMATKIQATA